MSRIRSLLLSGLVAVGLIACGGGGGGGGGGDAPSASGGGGGQTATTTAPVIATQPQGMTVDDGQAVSFGVNALSTAPMTYQWKRNGVNISGATAARYELMPAQLADNGAEFSVAVTNSAGTVNSSAASLQVRPVAPNFVTSPGAQTVLAGTQATVSVVAKGTAPLRFQWTRNGTPIAGATDTSYTTPATTMSDSGAAYSVSVTNDQGTIFSLPVLLQVTPVPNAVAITAQPQNVSTAEGTVVSFSVTASGTGPFDYQWFKNGNALPDAHEATLRFPATALDNASQLTVSVTNALGSVSSSAANLSVSRGDISLLLGGNGGWGNRDGAAELASFAGICGLAKDGSGNYFATDAANHTIRKIDTTKNVSTLAGTSFQIGSADGVGASARFYSPGAAALDSVDSLYVADTANQTIRRISISTGLVTTLAGTAGISGAADGTGASARFNLEANSITCSFTGQSGLAVDSSGYVYVADSKNHAIRKVSPMGVVTTFAGALGVSGSADGNGTNARFNHPTGIAFDASQNLHVVDRSGKVRKITPTGDVSTLQINTSILDGALAITSAGEMFAADFNGFRSLNIPVPIIATSLNNPAALAPAANGDILVAGENGIKSVNPRGKVTQFAGNSGYTYGYTDGPAATAQMNGATGIASDAAGNLYFADKYNQTIRMLSASGTASTIAGAYLQAGSTDGIAANARFNEPERIARDAAGNLYVSDAGNHTIRKISAGGTVSTLAGTVGVTGSSDGTGLSATMNNPGGLTVDTSGNVYFVDRGNLIVRKIATNGTVSTIAGSPGASGNQDGTGSAARFSQIRDITIDSSGNLYVTDNFSIRKITQAGVVTTFAGSPTFFGSTDGTGTAARFSMPNGLTIDSNNNLFVGEQGSNAATLRKVTPAGVVTTVAGSAGLWGLRLGNLPGSFDHLVAIAIAPSSSGTKVFVSTGHAIVLVTLP